MTFTEKVQLPLAASAAPDRLTAEDPGFAVIVPPPHVPESPFGLETTRPACSVSVNEIPDWFDPLGTEITNCKGVDWPTGIVGLPKDFVICSGATTVRFADAVRPVPALVDVTVLVVFVSIPDPVAVTVTLKVHGTPGATVAPDSPIELAVTVSVPPQAAEVAGVAVIPTKESVNATPAILLIVFRLVIVKPRLLVWPTLIELGEKPFPMLGGARMARIAVLEVPAAPCSVELICPVVLLYTPAVVPVTNKVTVQLWFPLRAIVSREIEPAVEKPAPPQELL